MFKTFHDTLLANNDIFLFDEDFNKVTLFANEMGIIDIGLYKINLDDDNSFHKDDPDTTIYAKLLTWNNKFEK